MYNKSKQDLIIKHINEAGDKVIKSNNSLTLDTRESGGINGEGNLKVESKKDVKIIGDGKSSDDMDRNIKKVIKDKEALSLYESNKKYKPTVIFTKEKYSAETSSFVIKKSTLVSEGEIKIKASNLEVVDSIIAAGKSLYLQGMEEVKCMNSYIGSPDIYIDHFSVLPSLVNDCKIEGALHFLDLNSNQYDL